MEHGYSEPSTALLALQVLYLTLFQVQIPGFSHLISILTVGDHMTTASVELLLLLTCM